ncbi:FAD/FMN-containing dehydrogenase [Parafrankia irregularis]|uniref:FAD/FMN-containing dehydrogenase n=1 Tax=Parafrankia irregularis TaxID=795642 RepID=A0A0S4QUH5_9ACTN|nr:MULTISPECIES: FAD-binding protein [Parafrankia]MBE3199929.1 FAD-binding protein [Parafrankia sp. CH37]CUU58086.1 FAD/FMN-containing dehydrogenase [Parafrankia irregularis]
MPADVSRRKLLASAGILGAAGVSAEVLAADQAAVAAPATEPAYGGATVRSGDARYQDLVRSWNGRFAGSPEYVRMVGTTAQVEQAVAEAVRAGKRIAVRSGGHCIENFVANSSVQVQIDMAQMNAIYYDPARTAFAIEPGATLREVYKTLFTGWGVTLPGGTCPAVGVGGHFAGGGYGALARRAGIVPDHLYAVEVVTVDRSGSPRTVVATREPGDPNRELWWAHTGGGGGNFGVVTKYWMRSTGATGTNPSKLLPTPPARARLIDFAWPWSGLDVATFSQLVRGYLTWHAENSAPDAAATRLSANLTCAHVSSSPVVGIQVLVNPDEADSEALLAGFRAAVVDPVRAALTVRERTLPWLQATNYTGYPDTGAVVGRRNKSKGSYLRASYTDAQLATTHRYLTAPGLTAPLAGVLFASYGGRANAVAPDATATPQRDSVLKVLHTVHWDAATDDDRNLSWLREFYRDVHADTGGVPALGGVTDGSYINYADVDLADPAWNTSGIPWTELYYKGSYRRLQQVKARWDPRNVFRHALSIALPS